MDNLQRIRDTSIQTKIPCPGHFINGPELYLQPNITKEDAWQWTASNK